MADPPPLESSMTNHLHRRMHLLFGWGQCTVGCGCASPRVARHIALRIPDPAVITEGSPIQTCNDSDHAILAGETVDGRDCATSLRPAVAITSAQRPPLISTGAEDSSLGLALERLNLNAVGLPQKVI